ncbi:Crp/Fnr family transcriptional regulator [Aurantimonas sp. VKM B-3413]|uniref:Crp/Fnr family transcriptional regulator n=1 Tax=Aurantimonas sp. VKM B-3413 TaxID=2779401 RepID=UPI001E38DD6E|nr:Crp/Fnr family transcriptional regulator [Aurantimonas sp. VKM B-3413]
MTADERAPLGILVRRLERASRLDEVEAEALLALPHTVRDVSSGAVIGHVGERPGHCCLIAEGFLCRDQSTSDGRRQILSFYIPGDIPDLQTLHLKTLDHNVVALTDARVIFIAHDVLTALCRERPVIGEALWRETLIDAAITRSWITMIGRNSARVRVAHLICELALRLDVVDMAEAMEFKMPITQQEVGDALGLSIVSVNRALQDLRSQKLISLKRRVLTVHDWDRMKRVGQFDPLYLHLHGAPPGSGIEQAPRGGSPGS